MAARSVLVGRYELLGPFATGGMASVHFGRLSAPGGFRKTVAIKVPHAPLLRDPAIRAMFLDEARLVSRIRSPYVVATLDVIEEGGALYQVMDYAHGPPLSAVLKAAREREEPVPIAIAIAIAEDVLLGLHAAHEAKDDGGAPLEIVHRDVSPQNVLVDEDGTAKVIDFGIASAANKLHLTQPGEVKGKISYMAPEQIEGRRIDRRADVYAAGVLLYETLTGARPFAGEDFTAIAAKHALETPPEPRTLRADVPEELSPIVMRALEKKPHDRFPTANAMAEALLALPVTRAPAREVAEWLRETSREFFVARGAELAELTQTDAAPPVALPEEPTRLAPDAAPRRARMLGGAAALLVVAGATALFLLRSRLPDAPSAPTTSVATMSARPSAPAPSAIALAPAPSTSPLLAATALAPHVASTRAVPRTSASSTVTAAPLASTTAAATAKPPCCSGELRLRVTECTENCPPGI